MVVIDPKIIRGDWRLGYVLDRQVLRSTFLGYDERGIERYDNTRSQLGELVYRLKYKQDRQVIHVIAETAAEFIKTLNLSFDYIVPAPASKTRGSQPVWAVAEEISRKLGVPLCKDCVRKIKATPQLKDIKEWGVKRKLLIDAFIADPDKLKGRNMLLFDDLYDSGATLNAITKAAYETGEAADVYALALTKTGR